MIIPLKQNKTPDVFDYGFDRNLNRNTRPVISSVAYSEPDAQAGQNLIFGSTLVGSRNTNVTTDPKSGFWIGNAAFSSAPFRVDMSGNLTATSVTITGVTNFGGTGADGALSISSGTTTLSMTSAQVFIKNYTSISITGTAQLAFSSPNTNGTLIDLRSQGAVTITSSTVPAIDVRGMGGAGGAGGTGISNGTNGSNGTGNLASNNGGTGGTGNGGTTGGAGGTGPLLSLLSIGQPLIACPGAGGAGGGSQGSTQTVPGNGATGGGALIIECRGAYNCSSTLNASGNNGTAAGALAGTSGAGGGGGGGGGTIYILYDTLTADTGTYTVAGGTGGAGTSGGTPSGAGGGGAGYNTNGAAGGNSGGTGGAGGNGASLVALNKYFS